MIINHSNKFIFVHVPKAAGSTVTRTFSDLTRYCDQEIGGTAFGELVQKGYADRFGLMKHSSAIDIKKIVGDEVWDDYFSFGFVRNPYSRLVSTYYFLKSWNGLPARFRAQIEAFTTVEEFLNSDIWEMKPGVNEIFRPQTHWLCENSAPKRPLVSFVGRVETLAQDMASINTCLAKALPPSTSIKSTNRSPKYPPYTAWSENLCDRIQRRYRSDFNTFGYSTDPKDTRPK